MLWWLVGLVRLVAKVSLERGCGRCLDRTHIRIVWIKAVALPGSACLLATLVSASGLSSG
eukprot:11286896-Alexandrium_andersonii.AAC.1